MRHQKIFTKKKLFDCLTCTKKLLIFRVISNNYLNKHLLLKKQLQKGGKKKNFLFFGPFKSHVLET